MPRKEKLHYSDAEMRVILEQEAGIFPGDAEDLVKVIGSFPFVQLERLATAVRKLSKGVKP